MCYYFIMTEPDKLSQMPFRTSAPNKSRQSLYAEESDDSDEDYKPEHLPTVFTSPEKKQNSQAPQSVISFQQAVIINKKTPNKPQQLLPSVAPQSFSDFNTDEYRDFTIRPLNIRQEDIPKHSSYGTRSYEKPNSQPNSQPMGLNFRYGAEQSNEQQPQIIHNNRVLMSSQGARWATRQNTSVRLPNQPVPPVVTVAPVAFSLSSDHFDRQNSKMTQQYDSFLRTSNDWIAKLSGLPFKVSLTQLKQSSRQSLDQFLWKYVDLGNTSQEHPSIEWEQEQLKKYFLAYKLSHRGLSRQQITAQSVALKKYKNCVYFGGIDNGKKEGSGVLAYFSKKKFEGIFVHDLKKKGLEIDEGEIYFGEFVNGVREGTGILKTQKEMSYGLFKNGYWATDGISIRDDSIHISFDNPSLKLIAEAQGDLYFGEVSAINEEKYGIGLQKFTNGHMYIGNYDNGKPEGYGEYFWANGAVYMGEFLSGLRHGKGRWYIPGGDTYEGEYMNDKKCGQGQYHWKNGTSYKGAFQNDYRHGYGEMYWANGRTYKGQWSNGIQNHKRIQFQQDLLKKQPAKLSRQRSPSEAFPKARLPILRKAPNTRKVNRSINFKSLNKTLQAKTPAQKSRSDFTTFNSTHRSIPREGIRALFNPNFNLEYS